MTLTLYALGALLAAGLVALIAYAVRLKAENASLRRNKAKQNYDHAVRRIKEHDL